MLQVRRALAQDFPALQQLLELYQYELSDIWPQEADAQARYGYDLARHRRGEGFHAYVALEGSQRAGFALARHVIHRHPGAWEVGQMPANAAAQAFWRRTITALTGGSFVEVEVRDGSWQGVVQQFHLPPAG